MRVRLALSAAIVVAASLSATAVVTVEAPVPVAAPQPWTDAWLLGFTDAYLDDDGARRDAVLRSLRNPDNLYARMRIAAYARPDMGWDRLPQWNPRTAVLDDADVTHLRTGALPTLPTDATPLWNGERPTTMAGWVALGREVFFRFPLRAEIAAEHAVVDDARAAETGLVHLAGEYPGLVVYRDMDGSAAVGITCALCHASEHDGALVVGRARRDFDFGAMRLAWHDASGEPIDPRMRARMQSWGPGRADITEDDDQDPVAIPDLWRLRDLRNLTQAATIVHDSPLALAIRQETQYIHASGERTRPPRELAWALAMYLYSLDAPAPAQSTASAATLTRGRAIFDRECTGCHTDATRSGEAIDARRVGTDPALANGTSRGTGMYRPAPLLAVADAAPYLHDGTVATLADLFDPARLRSTFDRGARGPGAVPGHAYATLLTDSDRAALVAWLETL
jgi:cytochrome c5